MQAIGVYIAARSSFLKYTLMNKHLGETFYADICDVVSINGQGVWKLTGNFHLNSMMCERNDHD